MHPKGQLKVDSMRNFMSHGSRSIEIAVLRLRLRAAEHYSRPRALWATLLGSSNALLNARSQLNTRLTHVNGVLGRFGPPRQASRRPNNQPNPRPRNRVEVKRKDAPVFRSLSPLSFSNHRPLVLIHFFTWPSRPLLLSWRTLSRPRDSCRFCRSFSPPPRRGLGGASPVSP